MKKSSYKVIGGKNLSEEQKEYLAARSEFNDLIDGFSVMLDIAYGTDESSGPISALCWKYFEEELLELGYRKEELISQEPNKK